MASDFKRKIITLLDLADLLSKASCGRFGLDKANQIQQTAKNSFGVGKTLAAFKDPAVSLFYQKKRSEGKDHLNAIGHVCNKILAIIFAVLRDNKPYVPASIS